MLDSRSSTSTELWLEYWVVAKYQPPVIHTRVSPCWWGQKVVAQHLALNLKSLRRIKDQDGKAEGDDKVCLMSLALVLINLMAIMALKLMKGSI